MIEFIAYLFVAFASIFLITSASEAGFMSNRFKKSFAGSGLTYGGLSLVDNYTNMVSFYEVAGKGLLGLGGYIFIAGSIFVLIVWGNNLLKAGQAIR